MYFKFKFLIQNRKFHKCDYIYANKLFELIIKNYNIKVMKSDKNLSNFMTFNLDVTYRATIKTNTL